MIIVVCLNPALDITHQVPAVDWAGVNRPSAVHARPGGKGLNVARTLHALGAEVLVMGLAGGVTGDGVGAALGELGVPAAFTPVSGETRRTFTVVDGRSGGTALFSEPGPRIGAGEFAELAVRYREALGGCAAVVLSGSLPPGLPAGSYATLIELATRGRRARGARHARRGPAGRRGRAARHREAEPGRAGGAGRAAAGPGRGPDRRAVADAAHRLRAAGAQAVVASLGAEGLLAATEDGSWQARPAAAVTGNPTGAGDAVAAGLAHGLVLGRPWDERLRHAVALGTATAAAPVAGEFSHDHYASALAAVTVQPEEAR